MTKRSVFVQASTLDDSVLVPMVQRAKANPDIEAFVLAEWSENKTALVKSIIPYNPSGPYKRLYVGTPAPISQDYRNILSGDFRWNSLEAASAAAIKAKPYADGWYISYETGMNVFSSDAFREPWEWYLGDMVRRLRAVKDVPILWSPYLVGPYSGWAVEGWAKMVKSVLGWYSPGAKLEIAVQDGVGARLQTMSSALRWIRAMRSSNTGADVRANVEWFDILNYQPIDARGRESYYAALGVPVGASWEIRYIDAILSAPLAVDTMLERYLKTVSTQPPAGQAPNNRDHAYDKSGPYYERAQWASRWGRNLIAQFPGIWSAGQWRALSVLPTPGSGRDPNSDHYSGGAFDFGMSTFQKMNEVAAVVRTDQSVSFVGTYSDWPHLHVSFKLAGDLP